LVVAFISVMLDLFCVHHVVVFFWRVVALGSCNSSVCIMLLFT